MAQSSVIRLALGACVVLAGCAVPRAELPFTAEGFSTSVQVVDDPMSTNVLVRTPPLPMLKGNERVYSSTFELAAGIDRRTGATLILVRAEIYHGLGSWQFFRGATYLDLDGLPKPAANFSRQPGSVSSCGGGSCDYSEEASFSVSEEMLMALVVKDRLRPDPEAQWRVRFNTDRGPRDASITFERIDGFLRAVGAARQRLAKGLVTQGARNATVN